MRGILRPCRHQLGSELHARWLGHLCGLCLSLRDTAGQSSRALTGYDILLVSVITEAQSGPLETTTAGPCALRGFRTAEVVGIEVPAMRSTTAVALLTGSATLADKIDDKDLPTWSVPALRKVRDRFSNAGHLAAKRTGLDTRSIAGSAAAARHAEERSGASLDELLAPSGRVVADIFAHTATTAGLPGNVSALRRAGDAFGRILHLVDAVEDRASDRRHGRFNPLDATRTSDDVAGAVARELHADLLAAIGSVRFVDGALAEALLHRTLGSAITRVWGEQPAGAAPAPRPRTFALGVAAALVAQMGMWGGGRRGGRW